MSKIIEKNCTDCESENIEKINYTEEVNVRGEKFKVETSHWHCKDCDAYWRLLGEDDYMAKAFSLYRNKHKKIQPEELKELRKSYKLTQADLSRIFGWGIRTISRYENGSMQSKSHESLLELLRTPKKLYNFIKDKEGLENREKYLTLIENTQKGISSPSIEEELEKILSYSESEYTGFINPSVDKIVNAILFFCQGEGTFITKLNKLLFYTDFKYFKEYIISLTGLRYRRFEFGPVPEKYYKILAALINLDKVEGKEVLVQEQVKTMYRSLEKPDLNVFSIDELETLVNIKKKFDNLDSTEISEFSHKEKAWIENEENEAISYAYARDLTF